MTGAPLLVTGAAGFIGSAIVRRACAAGHRVRAVVRDAQRAANLDGLDVEIAVADLRDAAALRRAMEGSRQVLHVAADYRLWAPDPQEIVRNNVALTRSMIEAALDAGVERVVYTSSVATIAPGEPGRPGDETMPLAIEQAIGAYKQSKVAAERLVEAAIASRGLPAVIVHPSTPLGPRDARPTPTGRIVVEAANGRIPAFVDTGLNLVHVDDVADGHLAALERGRIGERYILGGQDASLAELLGAIAVRVGRRPPTVRLPRRALFPFAHVAEAIGRARGREPMLTVDGLRMARHRMYFSSAKAERELGYRARPYGEAIDDALMWFRAAGMVR